MGKLIAVVGNSGVGKTTLARALCQRGSFVAGLEQHSERPFQQLFAQDLQRWGLANQIDYLLYRAEQEEIVRRSDQTGIHDGGLDLDFHLFAKHFHRKGYLSEAEFILCERLYTLLRSLLPPPDLIIYLRAPVTIAAQRYARRGRSLEIAALADLEDMDRLLTLWMAGVDSAQVIEVDASHDEFCTPAAVEALLAEIDARLAA